MIILVKIIKEGKFIKEETINWLKKVLIKVAETITI